MYICTVRITNNSANSVIDEIITILWHQKENDLFHYRKKYVSFITIVRKKIYIIIIVNN